MMQPCPITIISMPLSLTGCQPMHYSPTGFSAYSSLVSPPMGMPFLPSLNIAPYNNQGERMILPKPSLSSPGGVTGSSLSPQLNYSRVVPLPSYNNNNLFPSLQQHRSALTQPVPILPCAPQSTQQNNIGISPNSRSSYTAYAQSPVEELHLHYK
jgi:hypothetical protein